MGQLSSHTSRESTDDTAPSDHRDYDLRWLGLLDQLYGLIEAEGVEPIRADTGPQEWPPQWQPLIRSWAARIGARVIQIVEPQRMPSLRRHEPRFSHRRSLHAQPPAHRAQGLAIVAQSMSAEGFTASQEREFHAFYSHLDVALGLAASLDAAQQSLAGLYDVFDTLPMSIALPEEQSSSPQFGSLLLIQERCDPGRPAGISVPPALLARHLQDHFALTDKEMGLAWNLAQGVSLKQYAGLSGRSIETARAQLKSVFRKLGVTSQAGISMILFEMLHAVTLQSIGAQLASAMAERTAAMPQAPMQALPWQ